MLSKKEIVKKLSSLRKKALYRKLGILPPEIIYKLNTFATNPTNDIEKTLNERYTTSINHDNSTYHSYLKENYVQSLLPITITNLVENYLNIKLQHLRIAIMKPQFILDWHIDYDFTLRIHCDLNYPSDFFFKVKNKELLLKKEVGTVYLVNTSYLHKVCNNSNLTRHAIIGSVCNEDLSN